MPQQNEKPPIVSTLATLTGCAIIFGSLLLTVVFPRMHFGISIAIGAVLGTPFIVLGLRLHSQSAPPDKAGKQFWPTGTEARSVLWGMVAFVTFITSTFGPIAVFVFVSFQLPSGDNWGIVTIRLFFITLAILGWIWWVRFAISTIPNWFRGRLSDETLDAITRDETPEPPKTVMAAALQNWQLAVIATVSFCVALGFIDFDSPWFNIDAGPKRTRRFVRLIQWCRGNPNTVASSSVLVGSIATAWYVFRICRAAVESKQNSPDPHDETKC